MKPLLILLVGVAPAGRAKNWLLRRLGYDVHSSSRFGPCLLLGVRQISLGARSRVGPFNVFRDLEQLTLGEASVIGQWNWVSAAKPLVLKAGQGSLSLGEEAALTSRHYVDASGGVSIGSFTTIAGVRSTLITHGIDWKASRQSTKPITVGSHCLISSNVCMAPGTVIGDRIVVGMGATVAGTLIDSDSLYVAGRASAVKSNLTGDYFVRAVGFVDPPLDTAP